MRNFSISSIVNDLFIKFAQQKKYNEFKKNKLWERQSKQM